MVKELVRYFLRKIGYRLVSSSVEVVASSKYESLIENHATLLRNCGILPTLPQMTQERMVLISQLMGLSVPHAMLLIDHLNTVLGKDGDVCEFGVAQGATSALLANEIRDTKKKFWAFDSFQGLPKSTDKDELINDVFNLGMMEKYAGTMRHSVASVRNRLAQVGFPGERTEIVPGFIEETIKSARMPSKVLFAFVDFDLYEPIKIALDFLDKVLVQSGFVIIHAYKYFSTGAKLAVEEFLSERKSSYHSSFPDGIMSYIAILQRR